MDTLDVQYRKVITPEDEPFEYLIDTRTGEVLQKRDKETQYNKTQPLNLRKRSKHHTTWIDPYHYPELEKCLSKAGTYLLSYMVDNLTGHNRVYHFNWNIAKQELNFSVDQMKKAKSELRDIGAIMHSTERYKNNLESMDTDFWLINPVLAWRSAKPSPKHPDDRKNDKSWNREVQDWYTAMCRIKTNGKRRIQ